MKVIADLELEAGPTEKPSKFRTIIFSQTTGIHLKPQALLQSGNQCACAEPRGEPIEVGLTNWRLVTQSACKEIGVETACFSRLLFLLRRN